MRTSASCRHRSWRSSWRCCFWGRSSARASSPRAAPRSAPDRDRERLRERAAAGAVCSVRPGFQSPHAGLGPAARPRRRILSGTAPDDADRCSRSHGHAPQPLGAPRVCVPPQVHRARVALRARARPDQEGHDGPDGGHHARRTRLRADRHRDGIRCVPCPHGLSHRAGPDADGPRRPTSASSTALVWQPAEPDELHRDLPALRRE